MQKIIVRYIAMVVAAALLLIFGLNWLLQGKNAETDMVKNANLKLEQISRTLDNNTLELENLKESLSEDYLTRAYAFAYIIEQNPDVLNSQEELQRITELLNVDELHVIDENGILFAGNIPLYFGMDFHSTEQTSEFLSILDDPDGSLVQEIRPNGYEQKVFQYIGVARQDKKGIVQIGMAPTRMLEAQKRNELSYILAKIPMDTGGTLFAIDKETKKILAHSDASLQGEDMKALGFTEKNLNDFDHGGFLGRGSEKTFYVLKEYEGIMLGLGKEEKVLYEERNRQSLLVSVYLIVSCLMVIVLINLLLKRIIVDGIYKIMGEITRITEGNLNTVVKVESNPEFKNLSSGINQMVQGILEASGKVSKIIDGVDMQIGVFEIENDKQEVMATAKLGEIMGWPPEEAREIYADKDRFAKALANVMGRPLEGEDGIYQLTASGKRWVKIQMSSELRGQYGVVTDVTDEVLDKQKIQHERDYDSLTGLCNIDTLKREAESILEGGDVGCAAMVMLDLDNFKGVNDQYGHDFGDEYLRRCAMILKAFNGEKGIAARRSGDEFCIFLHHHESRPEIMNRMEEFYISLREEVLLFPDGTRGTLSISAGVAWYDETLKSYGTLLKAADYALYDAKNSGKGIIKQYTLL